MKLVLTKIKTNCKCYKCKFSITRAVIFEVAATPHDTLEEIFCKQLGKVVFRNEEIHAIKEMACNCFEKWEEVIPFKGVIEFPPEKKIIKEEVGC